MTSILGSTFAASTVAETKISTSSSTSVPSFEPSAPAAVAQAIEKSKGRDWQKVSIRALNFCSSVALGSFTGLAYAGVMVTPMGWAVASGALFMGLGLAKKTGGSSELMTNLGISAAGFALAVGPAYLSTKSVVATVVCIAAEIMLLFMVKMAWDKQAPKSNIPDAPAMDEYPDLEVSAGDEDAVEEEEENPVGNETSNVKESNPEDIAHTAQNSHSFTKPEVKPISKRRGPPRNKRKNLGAPSAITLTGKLAATDPRHIAVSTTMLAATKLQHIDDRQRARPAVPAAKFPPVQLKSVVTATPARA